MEENDEGYLSRAIYCSNHFGVTRLKHSRAERDEQSEFLTIYISEDFILKNKTTVKKEKFGAGFTFLN